MFSIPEVGGKPPDPPNQGIQSYSEIWKFGEVRSYVLVHQRPRNGNSKEEKKLLLLKYFQTLEQSFPASAFFQEKESGPFDVLSDPM